MIILLTTGYVLTVFFEPLIFHPGLSRINVVPIPADPSQFFYTTLILILQYLLVGLFLRSDYKL